MAANLDELLMDESRNIHNSDFKCRWTRNSTDADGYVEYPNVDILSEMVDLMTTTRTYEANANVVDVTREMANRALDIGR